MTDRPSDGAAAAASDHAALIARAQAVLRESLAPRLATSPLADMAEWVATGAPPPAGVLRDQGFLGLESPPGPQSEALRDLRKAFRRVWGFSIPSAEAVAVVAALGAPLVEIGAGTGYWTALLRAAGLDVIGTDIAADGEGPYGSGLGRHATLEALGGPQAVTAYPERDVFCSWPTKGGAWALAAARTVKVGRAFVLISDPPGGDVGTPGLHRYLATRFRLEAEAPLPQFPQVDDRLKAYRRIR